MTTTETQSNGLPLTKTNQPLSVAPQYQSLIDANPYRNAGATYNESPWQKLLSSLGFRTQADAWRENMEIQANEYDASIAQKAYDEQYNSAAAQTERMRNAGLNPDISGGQGISPGEAASLGQDPSTPMASEGHEAQLGHVVGIAAQCLDIVTGFFSSGFGLIDSAQGLVRNRLNNRLLGISSEDALQKFVEENAMNFLPEFPDDEVIVNPVDWKKMALANAEKFANYRFKGKEKRKFLSSIETYYNSAPGTSEAFKTWVSGVRNRKDYALESQFNFSQIDNVLKQIMKPFADALSENFGLSLEADKASLQEGISEDTDRKKYYDTLDSGLQAETENATNMAEKEEQTAIGALNEAINKAMSSLRETSKKGGLEGSLAQLGLVALALGRYWIASVGAPQVSRSTSVKQNSKGQTDYRQTFNMGWR